MLGNRAPLFVIDGVPIPYTGSLGLNPRDIESIARTGMGRLLIHSGHVDEGLAMLDEGTAAALSGELPPFPAGLVYCMTISACQELGDLRRAAEWTDVANKFCDRSDLSGFPGTCRIHRAQLMRLRGNWSGAEEQAITACEELHDFNYWATGNGLYEVAEVDPAHPDGTWTVVVRTAPGPLRYRVTVEVAPATAWVGRIVGPVRAQAVGAVRLLPPAIGRGAQECPTDHPPPSVCSRIAFVCCCMVV